MEGCDVYGRERLNVTERLPPYNDCVALDQHALIVAFLRFGREILADLALTGMVGAGSVFRTIEVSWKGSAVRI